MKSFMKKVSVFLFATSIFAVGPAVYAQGEYDDMYFKKTDRQKVKFASDKREAKKDRVQAEPINPQEGLSARNVNPEYIARFNEENTNVDSDEDLEYFSEDYSNSDYYSTQNQSNQMNPYGYGMHGMHTMAMMDPFMMHSWGWRSRHYNPYMWGYDPFMDPWGMGMMGHYGMMSPYGMGMMGGWGMRPGFGMSMGYGWNSWNRGWYGGMGMGMGFGWGRPMGMWGHPMGMGMWGHPMGMGMYNPYWGWGGGNVIIVNQWGEQGGRQVTRGSRSTGSSMIRQHTDSPAGSRAALAANNTRSGQATTNRSRNYTNAQNDYYNRSRTNVTNRTSPDRSRDAYSRPESRTSAVNRGSSLDPNRSSSQYRQRSSTMQNRSNYTPPARNRSTDFNRSAPPSRSGYSPQRSTSPRSFSSPSRGSSSPSRSFSSPSRGSSGGSFSAPSRGSSGGATRSGGGGSRGGRGN